MRITQFHTKFWCVTEGLHMISSNFSTVNSKAQIINCTVSASPSLHMKRYKVCIRLNDRRRSSTLTSMFPPLPLALAKSRPRPQARSLPSRRRRRRRWRLSVRRKHEKVEGRITTRLKCYFTRLTWSNLGLWKGRGEVARDAYVGLQLHTNIWRETE